MIAGIVASQVVDIQPAVDVAPVITSSNSVSVVENVTLSHALTANESVSWSIVGGADQARFEISGSTLRWLSNGTKNFEAPDDADTNNTYIVTVRATDAGLLTTDQTITATVTDADEVAPTITSSNTASVAENATLSHSLTANEAVTWSMVGGADQARFEISGSTLRWLSNGTKNFEAPDDADANNTYIVTVRATDTALNTADQTITVTVTDVSEGAPPLDGLSNITGAWSFSRQLLSAYGGSFYTASGGLISTLFDQSGATRNFTQPGADTLKPTETTIGGEAAAAFDGSNDYLTAAAISNFFANNNGYLVLSLQFDTLQVEPGGPTFNKEAIFGDGGVFIGLHATQSNLHAYNWDGNEDAATIGSSPVTTGTAYVIEWWHSGGTINVRLNGGTSASVASGNTTTLTGALNLAVNNPASATELAVRIAEVVAFNALPTLGQRDALVADMMAHVGA